jgi:hypothetical protein
LLSRAQLMRSNRLVIASRAAVLVLAIVSSYFSLRSLWTMWAPMCDFPIGMDWATARIDYVGPELVTGIKEGDRVDLAAMPFRDRAHLYEDLWLSPGFSLPVKIERGGSTQTVAVRSFLAPQAIDEKIAAFARKIVALLYALVAIILVWRRPTMMLWGLALFLLRTHIFWVADLYSEPLGAVIVLSYATIYALGWPGLIIFAARFPDNRTTRTTRYWDLAAAAFFLCDLFRSVYVYVPLFTARPVPELPDWTSAASTQFVGTAIFVALCWKALRSDGRSQWRGFRWVVAGYGVSILFAWDTLPYAFGYFSDSHIWGGLWWPVAAQQVFMLALPASVAYAMIRHRAFDLGYLTNRTLVYGVFAVGVVSTIVAGVYVASSLTSTVGIGFAMFFALLAGMTFQSTRAFVVRFVDRVVLHRRYEALTSLDALRDTLRGSSDPKRLTDEVARTLGLASLAVFLRAADGGFVRNAAFGWPPGSAWHLLPDEALTRKLGDGGFAIVRVSDDEDEIGLPEADARPRFAVALRRGDRVSGAILVGPQRNGANLDRDALRSLCGVFDEAVFA